MTYRRDNMVGLVLNRQGSSSYCRDLSTREKISSRPQLADPFEDRYVTVRITGVVFLMR